MNAEKESEANTMSRCASCGVKEGEGDNVVKLKDCSACHLVKYCGLKCQKQHRKKHKRACKQRATELYDELLFKQPESSCYGDCPICFLPLPIDRKATSMTCCSKTICRGCNYTNQMREIQEKQYPRCPFCRAPVPKSETESNKRAKDKADKNDPDAMCRMGLMHYKDGDYQTAFQYWSKAAELGDAHSQYQLASMYYHGNGVEKDESKAMYHYEQAAIGGHPQARYNLGAINSNNGQCVRAVKHWIIGAKLGDDESLDELKKEYKNGLVSKDDLTVALRGYQAAVDAAKSPQREAGEAYFLNLR